MISFSQNLYFFTVSPSKMGMDNKRPMGHIRPTDDFNQACQWELLESWNLRAPFVVVEFQDKPAFSLLKDAVCHVGLATTTEGGAFTEVTAT